jgi:radical SAM protein with 4Fe4S-binding SPASM domain
MKCQSLPAISYQEFSARLHQKALAERHPLGATLELTERCNLSCVHCYINRPAQDREARSRELTTRQWLDILDDMAAAGTLWVLFTGGEPLLRPDFREIYAHAKTLGMIVTIFTNGTLITPDLADFLEKWPPFLVEISVYGLTPETFEKVSRTVGSSRCCLRGIELLRSRQVPVKLKTVALTINAHELWGLKDWAEELGLNFRYDPLINLRLDGGRHPSDLRLSPEEVVHLDARDEKLTQFFKTQWAESRNLPDDNSLFFCGAGLNSYHVDAYGQLHICMMVRTRPYDLTRGSLAAGWLQFLDSLLNLKPASDYPCNRCELLILCGQCPGWALLEEDDLAQPVPYLCRLTHLRAQALGINPAGPGPS